MNLQPIFNIAEICHQHEVEDVIMSPGSRCAPLTLAFVRHKSFNCKIISDERSAAFIGLGQSIQSKTPTVLICTSGSASLNYAPAIAEAYFQQIPLLILTADRPPEWIDQLDGQTIRQSSIYGKHVKASYDYPVDAGQNEEAEWHGDRIISEALIKAKEHPCGPVHINIPLREPFYPKSDDPISHNEKLKVIKHSKPNYNLSEHGWENVLKVWNSSNRKLIIGGQANYSLELTNMLSSLSKDHKIPVLGDVISNLHDVTDVISHSDVILGNTKHGLHESLQPDLIVSFGLSTISKNLKLFLRNNRAVRHIHILPYGNAADTYKSLTNIVNITPEAFFHQLVSNQKTNDFSSQKQENYCHIWQIEERKVLRFNAEFFPQKHLGEFEVIKYVLDNCKDVDIHLANSMAVRYANLIGIKPHHSITVYSNRGTSGIDGSTSTAMGSAFRSSKTQLLITGDMAFFYDRNAFWHNYPHDNLKILLLNNHAGGIFRMIKGPSEQPELEEFFETKQKLNAKHLAAENGIEYQNLDKRSKMNNYVNDFLNSRTTAILEVETESHANSETLKYYKTTFQQALS